MKSNVGKHILVLCVCIMIFANYINVLAGYTSEVIGVTPNERATCELYVDTYSGDAYTTPVSIGTTVHTMLELYKNEDDEQILISSVLSSTRASSSTQPIEICHAESYHAAGPYATWLYEFP